jgi:hypothetical protein
MSRAFKGFNAFTQTITPLQVRAQHRLKVGEREVGT